MDAIFKALNDPARRALMDSLRTNDGQTLTELEEQLAMSRFGVMKHLRVLEDAHLVTTARRGRFKHHHLNPLPLQELVDRWVHPFLQPQTETLSALKAHLESETMTDRPDFVMSTFIRCTPEALWQALTDPAKMEAYHFFARRVEADGDTLRYHNGEGRHVLSARTLAFEENRRIEQTFEIAGPDAPKASRTVTTIEPQGEHCRLTVEHYDLTFPVVPGEGVHDGWSRWAAGLKSWLETGEALNFAPKMAS